MKRNFKRARECFEKSLSIDSENSESNYYLGLINLLGLDVDIDISKSEAYFLKAKNDSAALNALGYIYYTAPDYFTYDPVERSKYGSIYQDVK